MFMKKVSINFSYIWSLGIVVCFLLNTACTRPTKALTPRERTRGLVDVFAQGLGDNLYNITKFQVIDLPSTQLDESLLVGKTVRIKTASTGEKAKVSVSTSGGLFDPDTNISYINQYYFLDYDFLEAGGGTDSQKILTRFLGKVENFKGFPDTVYHIVPHLENNYLILYRLSDPKKLPFDELPVSIKVGDKVAAPLVGYPIDYCVAEKILDSNHQETGQSRPKCDVDVTQESATYIRLIDSRKQVFQYQPKIDIFPSDFFKGEWFFVKTFIKSSLNAFTGFHQSFASANLVEFKKNPDSLRIVDASGYKIREEDKVTGFSIPVEWKEYEMARDSDVIHQFSERENSKSRDIERPYFKIKFKKLVENEIQTNNTVIAETNSVLYTDNYFSFIIKVSGSKNLWVKYAFKKVVHNPSYIEKQWFETDSNKFFPSFAVVRKYYSTVAQHTQEDRDQFRRIARFDPYSKNNSVRVIKWYFSKQTPKDDWIRSFGRRAVDYWDKAFQEAGKDSNYKIRIVLDESKEKELGDIRYNIINLIVSPQSENPFLGYGPSIANPITGETLSSTANVFVSQIIDRFVVLLRNYIRFHIYPPAWKLLPNSPGVTDFMHEKIQKLCPEVTRFICDSNNVSAICITDQATQTDQEAQQKVFHPDSPALKDEEIIQKCVKKIAEADALNTTIHEMGHGFSYRHVMSASADKNNFYESYDEIKRIFGEDILTDETKSYTKPAQYSSVMDYGHFQFPRLTVPGKYDIAVTKFVYFDKVELVDGRVLDIPAGADRDPNNPQVSISRVAGEKQVQVRKYKVCGGKQREDVDDDDPLCVPFDYGVTPLEVVEKTIRLLQDYIMLSQNRYDSDLLPLLNVSVSLLSGFGRFWPKWIIYRDELISSKNLKISDYFFLDSEKVQNYQVLIQDEADKRPEFKAYYEIRKPIFDFYKKFFFLPPKHCIYQRGDDEYQAIALGIIEEKIRNDYPEDSREILVNCQSPVVKKWANENNKGTFITEVGYFINTRSYFLKPKSVDKLDEGSVFSTIKGMSPNWLKILQYTSRAVLNEPDFLSEMRQEYIHYFLNGRDLNPYVNEKRDITLPRFLSYAIDLFTVKSEQFFGVMILPTQRIMIDTPVISLVQVLTVEEDIEKIKRQNAAVIYKNEQDLSSALRDSDLSTWRETHPFIYSAFLEYENTNKETSFSIFLRKHPLVCVANVGNILVSYINSEDNIYVPVCRKFNEYKTCVENHTSADPMKRKHCEDIENKKAYIQYINFLIIKLD